MQKYHDRPMHFADATLVHLARRDVALMVGFYLVGEWLLEQVAKTVLPIFGTPDWLPRRIFILLAIGFISALVLTLSN